MSSLVAVPFGIASAVVYGTSSVFQHRVAQQQSDSEGRGSASGLLRQMRDPVWLLAIGGDVVGFLLQITALAIGQVVVIQPLVVLMLPVSLGVSYSLGGRRPTRGDYLGLAGVLAGLGAFLALIGSPHAARVPHVRLLGGTILVVLVSGLVLAALATRANQVVRGAVFGGVAGAFFGTHAVLVDAASDRFSKGGFHALLATHRGLVTLAGIIVLGGSGILLTQLSFQVGALGATLPANLTTDPLAGVCLGAFLLREHIPLGPAHLIAYLLCLAAVVAGAIRLADPGTEGVGADVGAPGPGAPDGTLAR